MWNNTAEDDRKFLSGDIDLPEAGDQLKAFVGRFGMNAVVADPSHEHFPTVQPVLESLGGDGATVRWDFDLQNSTG